MWRKDMFVVYLTLGAIPTHAPHDGVIFSSRLCVMCSSFLAIVCVVGRVFGRFRFEAQPRLRVSVLQQQPKDCLPSSGKNQTNKVIEIAISLDQAEG